MLLAGVGMVGVNDAGRILESFFGIHLIEKLQILIVIVRMCMTMLINSTTKNRVCIRIAVCCGIPSAVEEIMTMLSSNNRVQHNG